MAGSSTRPGVSARAAIALAACVLSVALLAAGPAAAAPRKVVGGETALTVPKSRVAALTADDLALVNISPASFRFVWDDSLSWRFGVPMGSGGTFDFAAKKGTFYHRGGLRFVNVADDRTLRLTGLRVVVRGPSSIVLSAAVGNAPVTRADVMVATGTPTYVKKGKVVTIDGVQFKLAPAAVVAIQTALGVTPDTTTVFAVADLHFKTR